MNATHLRNTSTVSDRLDAALVDLERVTSAVIQHNAARMQHSHVKAWLVADRREPCDTRIGIVSTAPAAQIRRRLLAGDTVTVAEVSLAIARMQRAVARAVERAKRHAAD